MTGKERKERKDQQEQKKKNSKDDNNQQRQQILSLNIGNKLEQGQGQQGPLNISTNKIQTRCKSTGWVCKIGVEDIYAFTCPN